YTVKRYPLTYLLHSERSDECIDFTMMCFLFVCLFVFESVYSITSRNNASISNFGEVKSKYFPTVKFSKNREKQKKVTGKREFLRKTSFRPNQFFCMGITQKIISTTEIFGFSENFFFLKYRVYSSNFYDVEKFNTNFFINFPSNSDRERRNIIIGKIVCAYMNFKFLRNRVTI
ncbi:hypothetical protein AGLY_006550, partial [Aphis glycines]